MERPFARQLHEALRKKKLSVRKFAALTDPANPERGRRRIMRHLAGTQPTAPYRRLYADVLDAPELEGDEDDADDRVDRIARAVRRELRRAS